MLYMTHLSFYDISVSFSRMWLIYNFSKIPFLCTQKSTFLALKRLFRPYLSHFDEFLCTHLLFLQTHKYFCAHNYFFCVHIYFSEYRAKFFCIRIPSLKISEYDNPLTVLKYSKSEYSSSFRRACIFRVRPFSFFFLPI